MIDEGPVPVAIYAYYFLLTRGRPFVLPLLLLAHSSARLTYSRRGRTLRKLCVHTQNPIILSAGLPVLVATTVLGRRQVELRLFSELPRRVLLGNRYSRPWIIMR